VSGSEEESTVKAIAQLAALVEEYGSVPRAIFTLISIYLLSGIFDIIGVVTGSVLYVFDLGIGSLRVAQGLLIRAFGAVGVDVIETLITLQQEIGRVVESAGPLGPPIAVVSASVMLYVGYRVAVALLGEIPGGSTLVDILRLR